MPYSVVGLQYCGIDTSTPGRYNITYHLKWPSVGELVLSRLLTVQEVCLQGEHNCVDGSCSVDGYCPLQPTFEASAATNGAQLDNKSPSLYIFSIVGAEARVPRGLPYKVCGTGQIPTDSIPCEPLGTANDIEDGSLTRMIVLCPPADCAMVQCRSHLADRKQPAECGVDTAGSAVGTSFTLLLAVYDSQGANATAIRTVTVVSPCTQGQYECPVTGSTTAQATSEYTCSDVPCDTLASISNLPGFTATYPRLFLLPAVHVDNMTWAEANQTLHVAYGRAPLYGLDPCSDFDTGLLPGSITQCAAIANDTKYGDITAGISTTFESVCANGSINADCNSCNFAAMAGGLCPPGSYRIVYSVTGSRGLTLSRALVITVEQTTSTVLELRLAPKGTAPSWDAAASYASDLATNTTLLTDTLTPILEVLGFDPGLVRQISLLETPTVVAVNSTEARTFATEHSFVAVVTVNVVSVVDAPSVATSSTSAEEAKRRMLAVQLTDGIVTATNVTLGSSTKSTPHPALRPTRLGRQALNYLDAVAAWMYTSAQTSLPVLFTSNHGVPSADSNIGDEGFDLLVHSPSMADSPMSWQPSAESPYGVSSGSALPGSLDAGASPDHTLALDPTLNLHVSLGTPQRSLKTLSTTTTTTCGVPQLGGVNNVSAIAAASLGLVSVGNVTSSCLSPVSSPLTLTLSSLISAVSSLEQVTDQMAEQQDSVAALLGSVATLLDAKDAEYQTAVQTWSVNATAALAAVSTRVDGVLQLLDQTAAVQVENAAVTGVVIDLVQTVLNSVTATTEWLVSTTSVLDGMGLQNDDTKDAAGSDEELATYLSCVYKRASDVVFYFNAAHHQSAKSSGQYGSSQGSPSTPSQRHRLLQHFHADPEEFGSASKAANTQSHNPEDRSSEEAGPDQSTLSSWLDIRAQLDRATFALSARNSSGLHVNGLGPCLLASCGVEQMGLQGRVQHRSLSANILSGQGQQTAMSTGRSFLYSIFDGYDLPMGQGYDYSLWDVRTADRTRTAGMRANKVLAGLLLHQVRRSPSVDLNRPGCHHSAFTASLSSAGCRQKDGNSIAVGNSGQLGGIGSDPAFNRYSALYQPSLKPGDFYNTSEDSPDITPSGLPYGFFHEPLARFPAGYPVLLDTRLSARRAEQAIMYLRDGGYLSATMTRSLRAQLVSYNPDAQVFGYWRLDFTWLDSGLIEAKVYLHGLPAISYGDLIRDQQVSQFLPDIIMVLFILLYISFAVRDMAVQFRVQRQYRLDLAKQNRKSSRKASGDRHGNQFLVVGTKRSARVQPTYARDEQGDVGCSDSSTESESEGKVTSKAFVVLDGVKEQGTTKKGHTFHKLKYAPRVTLPWVLYEAAVSTLMIAAITVLFSYAVRLSVRDEFTSRFDVYEGDTYMPARYFLVRRNSTDTAAADTDVNDTGTADDSTGGSASTRGHRRMLTASESSGESSEGALSMGEGLWKLPGDPSGLEQASLMFARVSDMYTYLVVYTFLQGFILAMLLLRWIHQISFQPRLSIVMGTLVAASADLAHMALVVITCIVMFGAAACIVFGTTVSQLSSYGAAMYVMIKYVVLTGGKGIFKDLVSGSSLCHANSAERLMAGLLYSMGPLLFGIVFLNFTLAILAWPFKGLKRAVQRQPTILRDLARIIAWRWDHHIHGAPKNKRLLLLLEAWLLKERPKGIINALTALSQRALEGFANIRRDLVNRRQLREAQQLDSPTTGRPSSRPISASRFFPLVDALQILSKTQFLASATSGLGSSKVILPGSPHPGSANVVQLETMAAAALPEEPMAGRDASGCPDGRPSVRQGIPGDLSSPLSMQPTRPLLQLFSLPPLAQRQLQTFDSHDSRTPSGRPATASSEPQRPGSRMLTLLQSDTGLSGEGLAEAVATNLLYRLGRKSVSRAVQRPKSSRQLRVGTAPAALLQEGKGRLSAQFNGQQISPRCAMQQPSVSCSGGIGTSNPSWRGGHAASTDCEGAGRATAGLRPRTASFSGQQMCRASTPKNVAWVTCNGAVAAADSGAGLQQQPQEEFPITCSSTDPEIAATAAALLLPPPLLALEQLAPTARPGSPRLARLAAKPAVSPNRCHLAQTALATNTTNAATLGPTGESPGIPGAGAFVSRQPSGGQRCVSFLPACEASLAGRARCVSVDGHVHPRPSTASIFGGQLVRKQSVGLHTDHRNMDTTSVSLPAEMGPESTLKLRALHSPVGVVGDGGSCDSPTRRGMARRLSPLAPRGFSTLPTGATSADTTPFTTLGASIDFIASLDMGSSPTREPQPALPPQERTSTEESGDELPAGGRSSLGSVTASDSSEGCIPRRPYIRWEDGKVQGAAASRGHIADTSPCTLFSGTAASEGEDLPRRPHTCWGLAKAKGMANSVAGATGRSLPASQSRLLVSTAVTADEGASTAPYRTWGFAKAHGMATLELGATGTSAPTSPRALLSSGAIAGATDIPKSLHSNWGSAKAQGAARVSATGDPAQSPQMPLCAVLSSTAAAEDASGIRNPCSSSSWALAKMEGMVTSMTEAVGWPLPTAPLSPRRAAALHFEASRSHDAARANQGWCSPATPALGLTSTELRGSLTDHSSRGGEDTAGPTAGSGFPQGLLSGMSVISVATDPLDGPMCSGPGPVAEGTEAFRAVNPKGTTAAADNYAAIAVATSSPIASIASYVTEGRNGSDTSRQPCATLHDLIRVVSGFTELLLVMLGELAAAQREMQDMLIFMEKLVASAESVGRFSGARAFQAALKFSVRQQKQGDADQQHVVHLLPGAGVVAAACLDGAPSPADTTPTLKNDPWVGHGGNIPRKTSRLRPPPAIITVSSDVEDVRDEPVPMAAGE